jgi:hypothetical protein
MVSNSTEEYRAEIKNPAPSTTIDQRLPGQQPAIKLNGCDAQIVPEPCPIRPDAQECGTCTRTASARLNQSTRGGTGASIDTGDTGSQLTCAEHRCHIDASAIIDCNLSAMWTDDG